MLKTVGTREYTVEEVLSLATTERRAEQVFEGYRVRLDSLRYQVFKQSLVCAQCGLEGTLFLLQHATDGGPEDRAHFNLYGRVGGKLVLFTKDHTHPRSKGGKDHVSNLKTMCFPCNFKKADSTHG